MGKGRDKRKKHEDPDTVVKRMQRQARKAQRGEKKDDGETPSAITGGLNGEEDIAETIVKLQRAENKRRTVSEVDLPGPPTPRANALWFPVPGRDGEFVLFGGEFWDGEENKEYNDLLIYNVTKNKWRQILAPGAPCPRSSCQGWVHKNNLYVHGGEIVSRTQSQFMHFKDLWRIDINTCVWEELSKGKGGPTARSGHRVAAYKRGCVLFGGFFDNGMHTIFYDDLWVLSDADGACDWREVHQPSYAEKPHPRSGHSLCVHNDDVFVFGGYFTFRASRFVRAEATVLHDLWTINLAAATPMWTKVKLAGIPPPIRCGMASFVKDKRMFLFGGVVDLDGAGGKTMSTFHNDLFVFNMETQRFFPIMMKPKSTKKNKDGAGGGAAAVAAASSGGSDLASEIARIAGKNLKKKAAGESTGISSSDSDSGDDDSDESSSSSDDDEDVKKKASASKAAAASGAAASPTIETGASAGAATTTAPPKDELLVSAITLRDGNVVPCPRMNAMICIHHQFLLIYGGVFEMNGGKREVALSDVFSLNINTMDGYTAHLVQDIKAVPWKGEGGQDGNEDGNSDAGSWEDGSTVAPDMMDALMEDLDEEEEEERNNNNKNSKNNAYSSSAGKNDDDDDDDDEAPQLVGALAQKIAAANADHSGAAGSAIDGRKTIKGKIGKGHHLEQLKSQLNSSTSIVPTPMLEETHEQFFARTEGFWANSAAQDLFGLADPSAANKKQRGRITTTAEEMSKMRFLEAKDLLRQIAVVEMELRNEREALRGHLKQRAALAAAAAAAAAAAEQEDEETESESSDEEEESDATKKKK